MGTLQVPVGFSFHARKALCSTISSRSGLSDCSGPCLNYCFNIFSLGTLTHNNMFPFSPFIVYAEHIF
jgi:hypothetical protein